MKKTQKFIVKIFIMEENALWANTLYNALKRFETGKNYAFEVTIVNNVREFLVKPYDCGQVVFVSIEQSDLAGMDIARSIREENEDVLLILTSQDESAAIDGYEVDAFDYLLKTCDFERFSRSMEAMIRRVQTILLEKSILIRQSRSAWSAYVKSWTGSKVENR